MSTEATELPIMTSAPEANTQDTTGEYTHDTVDTQLMSPVICYRDPAEWSRMFRQENHTPLREVWCLARSRTMVRHDEHVDRRR